MNFKEVKQIISKIIFDLGMSDKMEVDNETFKEVFEIIDSLNLINFVVELENKFDIELPDEYLLPENFTSIDFLAEYILSIKGE